jgi:hypothetical protein
MLSDADASADAKTVSPDVSSQRGFETFQALSKKFCKKSLSQAETIAMVIGDELLTVVNSNFYRTDSQPVPNHIMVAGGTNHDNFRELLTETVARRLWGKAGCNHDINNCPAKGIAAFFGYNTEFRSSQDADTRAQIVLNGVLSNSQGHMDDLNYMVNKVINRDPKWVGIEPMRPSDWANYSTSPSKLDNKQAGFADNQVVAINYDFAYFALLTPGQLGVIGGV